jgi:uncharacterized protein YbaR (Trm112 family)
MRVEIIELLRCPEAHEQAALVTVAFTRDGDRLLSGELGCPVCSAAYTLRDGVVWLVPADARTSDADVVSRSDGGTPDGNAPGVDRRDAEGTAALLDLSEPGMRAVLCGAYGTVAAALADMTGARCIAIDGAAERGLPAEVDQVRMVSRARLPFADACIDALAVDATHAELLADAARVVRVGGRVLAPSHLSVPQGLKELARDATEWVADVVPRSTAPVGLRRARATWPE